MFSQTTEYAIRAAIEMARDHEGRLVLASDLAKSLAVPQHYLAKILQQLVRARVLQSTRGRLGGFSLMRPAEEITLREVVEPFEDLKKKEECLLGQALCNDERACPMHEFWKVVRTRYLDELDEKTLKDLADFDTKQRAKVAAEGA